MLGAEGNHTLIRRFLRPAGITRLRSKSVSDDERDLAKILLERLAYADSCGINPLNIDLQVSVVRSWGQQPFPAHTAAELTGPRGTDRHRARHHGANRSRVMHAAVAGSLLYAR